MALNFANSYYQKVDTRTHLSSDEIEMLPIKLRIIYILISDLDIRDIDYLDEKKNWQLYHACNDYIAYYQVFKKNW